MKLNGGRTQKNVKEFFPRSPRCVFFFLSSSDVHFDQRPFIYFWSFEPRIIHFVNWPRRAQFIRCGFLLLQIEDLFNDEVSCIPYNIINLSIWYCFVFFFVYLSFFVGSFIHSFIHAFAVRDVFGVWFVWAVFMSKVNSPYFNVKCLINYAFPVSDQKIYLCFGPFMQMESD